MRPLQLQMLHHPGDIARHLVNMVTGCRPIRLAVTSQIDKDQAITILEIRDGRLPGHHIPAPKVQENDRLAFTFVLPNLQFNPVHFNAQRLHVCLRKRYALVLPGWRLAVPNGHKSSRARAGPTALTNYNNEQAKWHCIPRAQRVGFHEVLGRISILDKYHQ